ncbi:MAG: bifunctional phosphopantothenoylcysteine decarboxylase/phosphopantothenate--cysteine ligase CoaBC [Thermodesulfovibrionia bacterium]|nr:bifunctional phosphopantothenoylcysteine decarboxylase/phosphopantothenate--cysteine ligase CoaBC [Thermodesulfovibrionia bacterium]
MGKNILLCVTGSIAAYKSVGIARRLIESGASVNVVMTRASERFITPLTFESVTGKKVFSDLFDEPLSHISLPEDTDLLLIAPATANIIGKYAAGIADDMLTTILLAYDGPVLIAPAMNSKMYSNPIVKKNIKYLSGLGVKFIGPESGALACGDKGVGRMSEPDDIVEAVINELSVKDLKGRNIVVTAGPTIEPIDPVRFISNRSSGKMGYEIARAASRRGADVTLISGPSSLTPPAGVSFYKAGSATEMKDIVDKKFRSCNAVIMTAAVSDFTPSAASSSKIKKGELATLKLKQSPDILKELGKKKGRRMLVGFAAESSKDIVSAKKKLKEKNLDMIVLNDITKKDAGFNVDTNIVTIIDRNGNAADYPKMMKSEIADLILNRMVELWETK